MSLRRLPSGRWQGCVYVGSRRRTATFGLRRDAKAWEEEQRAALRRGDWRDPRLARTLFEDWLGRWLAARAVEPETAAADARTIARHILPRWAGTPLGSVGRLEVQAWVTGMSRAGVGQPTVAKSYALFAGCMAAAADEELIGRTPCRRIVLPTAAARRVAWWEPEQVELIVARLAEPHATIAALMAWCGLRWEEAAGLRVEDVSWLRREITVGQVVTTARRIKPYPKSTAGRRTVPMAGPVAARLEPHWRLASAGRSLPTAVRAPTLTTSGRSSPLTSAVTGGQGPTLLFEVGGLPPANSTWSWHWRRDWPPDVPYHSPHTLRHSGASWLAQGGVPLADVQAWLGHGDAKSTKRYAHLAPEKTNATVREAMADRAPIAHRSRTTHASRRDKAADLRV